MKKFLLIIATAMCLGFTSQNAMAAITSVADLCGTYSFSATKVSEAAEYTDVFPTSFEVTVEENVNVPNGVIIEGFAGSTNPMYGVVDITAKTVKVESMPAYGTDNAVVFSNAEGAYPYSQTNGYVSLTFSFDDDKKLSLGAYSIVTVDHKNTSATVLASFKDAVGVGEISAPAAKVNFAGTYKVTAANVYDYVNNALTSMNYDIVITEGTAENSYVVKSIAGYADAYMVNATAEGNVLTINLGYNFLTAAATYDLLGDASYGNEYSTAAALTITYEDGNYKMTDYSVWTATWSQSEGKNVYTRKLFMSGNTITEGPAQDETDAPVENIDFAGTYSAKAGAYYNYVTTQYCELPFDMVIEKGADANSYNITSFASYTDIYMLPATAEGNVLTINGAYNFLTAGQTYEQMGESSYSATEPTGEIKITYENGVYTMTNFLVWTVTWAEGSNTYKMKESFANITMTKNNNETAIESVEIDANAPVEYYNLQGVKVVNPSNGLFIKKQGNKAVKVIL